VCRRSFILSFLFPECLHCCYMYFHCNQGEPSPTLVPRQYDFTDNSLTLLWQVLEGLGISGRILECLRSMYRQDQACLHHPEEGLTPTFLCRIGVKQGCPFSPLLFGLFIDGLEKRLNALEGDAPPMLGQLAVRLLLYADDLALMSHTPAGL